MKENNKMTGLKKGMIIFFWLCVWQAAAVFVHNDILLVGPLQAARSFWENLARDDFFQIVFYSFARIGAGFLTALLGGLFLGTLSYRFPLLQDFTAPLLSTLKAVPVASFAVLLLIWAGSSGLSFFISFLIVFPNVYINTVQGLKSTDARLLEMAKALGMRRWNRIWYLYVPALMPYLTGCLKVSLGMAWKSGVAAEVIGMPPHSLGERLYQSKIYLDTAGLSAWTFLVILLSVLFEKGVLFLTGLLARHRPDPCFYRAGAGRRSASETAQDIRIRHVGKAYGRQIVLEDFSLTLKKGGRYLLMAPSGGGKTTLLGLLSGMVRADAGEIEGVPERIGMVFQEDRLCGDCDVVTNILLTAEERDPQTVREEALEILPEECLDQPADTLSGGMRRRAAVLRAMLSGAQLLMMDEPFTGLDEESRIRTAAYILKGLKGRTLLVTTHRAADAQLLDGTVVTLKQEL